MRLRRRLLAVPLLLAAAPPPLAPIDGLPIAVLPPQPAVAGCGAYLFATGPRAFVAVAAREAGTLTLALAGKVVALARQTANGDAGHGFAATTVYAGEGATATLAMAVVERPDLQQGAAVPEASLTIERAGADVVVVPLAGLVACAN